MGSVRMYSREVPDTSMVALPLVRVVAMAQPDQTGLTGRVTVAAVQAAPVFLDGEKALGDSKTREFLREHPEFQLFDPHVPALQPVMDDRGMLRTSPVHHDLEAVRVGRARIHQHRRPGVIRLLGSGGPRGATLRSYFSVRFV